MYLNISALVLEEVLKMTYYREILRLKSLGFSERNIAQNCSCSRNTISNVLKRARILDIAWPLGPEVTDFVLNEKFYPKATANISDRQMPDFAYIRKEMLKNGVNKKLLWTEYFELLHRRREKSSTIFCSQYRIEG